MVKIGRDVAAGRRTRRGIGAKSITVADRCHIPRTRIKEALLEGWGRAVDELLEDGLLSESEEKHLGSVIQWLGFEASQLIENESYVRVVKSAVIRDLTNGVLPSRLETTGSSPFSLQNNERLVWVFEDVQYYEDQQRTKYSGGSHGVSIRIAKGVYYRLGAFRGSSYRVIERVLADTGYLGVTNKHLCFVGKARSFRIRHTKIVSVTPFEDGVQVQRDALTAKPQAFITGDGWFTYNILRNVGQLR